MPAISQKTMVDALGGEEVVKKDARLSNMLWQTDNMLGGIIEVQDFIYIMHYTDTTKLTPPYTKLKPIN